MQPVATSVSSLSVTGPVDYVSDGEQVLAIANGHELLSAVTGTGCMSSAVTGCFLAVTRDRPPVEAAAEALAAFGVGGRGRRARREGTRLVPRRPLRRAGCARSRDARRPGPDLVKLHALVDELETARLAVEGGATVIQWRLKDVPRVDVVERGRATRSLCARHGVTFIVNDDVDAALMLGADGVHLGRSDDGSARAKEHGLVLGLSASSVEEARAAAGDADYIGAGPVWETPSKLDADPAIGLDGLREICAAVDVPVVAIGGIDATNAADCIRAGAAGVAVVRAARDAATVRAAIDAAL